MFKRWTSKSKRSVDLSFLNQEEVNAVLEVLERDKEVRRMNSERLKEVKKTNPNKLWLKGVTGEWFEDLKKSKFNNQTDLSKLLKVSRTWQSGKHNQPASTDSKLTRSQNCPQVKNVSSDMKSSGNSKGHESGDPVSKPVAAASESDRQKAELLLEKDRCSNYKSLQLESPAMLQQIDVHLKVATVPRVKRKVYMYRDICKHVFNNEQPKVLGQDPETKTSNVAVDEHGKIMSMENVSTSELQKNTRDEDGIKNLAEDVQARLCRNDNKMNAGKLSGSTEETSLIIGCNTKNVRHTSQARDVLDDEQQGNVCTRVELDHYKADNGLSSDPQTSLSSSIIHPQNELQDHPITNGHDLPTRSNSDCHSLKSKCAMEGTLLDLLVESQILPDIFNSPKNYSSNNICEPSQRNESDSTCSSETVPFSSMTGQRGHNTGNMHVLQQNWSDNLLDTSQKTDSALLIQGSKSEAIHLASSAVPVCIPHPLLFTCTNCRSNVNTLNHNNVSFKSGIVGDSLQISQLKPGISLSLRNQHCHARATSHITINSRKRQQYLRTDDTNIVTPVKRNNDSLQHHGHKQERTDLFSNPKAEACSVIMLALSKTRMETAKSKNADAPLSDDKKQTCKVEGRSNSLLSIQVIGSQLPTCDRDIDVAPVHASNNIGAALQRADNDYLQNAKPDIGHKLSADPKNAPQHLSSTVLSSYNNAIRGNPLKSDDVSVESANNILQNESGTSNVIEMSVTQSPKHEKQVFCNQRSSSNNSNLTLGVNSMENDKPLSIITSSKVLRIKYQMVDLSVRRDSLTAARLRYKSEANHVLSLPDATKAPLLDIKNDMKNTLQNMPPHKIRSILTDIPDVDNMQNYQTVKASTPPSDAMTQCQSPGYIHTNEVTLSKRYPTGGISNVAQQNSCESLPETVKDQQSPVTKAQLRQDAIRDGGKEILPKDRSETSSKLISENSVFDQCILAESMDSNQMKSQANVQLGDNFTTCPKSAMNYPPENNLFLSQDTLTGQQSPTNSHNLLFHSPVKSCTNEILEDCLSENYAVLHNQSETTCVSSFLDQMNSQPPLVNTTDGNGCESLNPSLDNCIHFVNTGLNKHLESCSSDPPSDSLNDPASTVQHSADRSMLVNSDLPLGRLVVQESLAAATDIKKNTLPHYSHEEPCDQNKSENLAETYTAITSPNNYPSKHSVYLSRNNHNIHVEEGVNEYLQNNSEHQGKCLPSEVLTDVKATATDIEMITDTLQHNTSNKTLHDEKSYDRFVSKKLHEMNSSLSSTLGTSKRYITVENNNKDDSQLHFPLGGDNTVDGRCKEYLEKGNCKLSTSDSLINLQPLNFMENITKTPTSSLSINNGSVGPDKEKTVKHCQSEYHSVSSLNACTAAYFTEGATNAVQNMCLDNNVLTFCGRTHDNNAQDKSKPQDLLTGDQFSTNTNTIPKFSMIPNNKDTTDHELLNSPGVSTTSEDRGNAILQISKRPTRAKNGINSFTNIPQKEILLTQFPLNYNTTPAAESIKTVENYQSDNRCTGLSQDGVTEQQSVTNLDNDRDKPWDHLLDISEIEINKNFQKGKPEINNVISPAIRHHSAVSVTGITKNTLQRGTSKVTDIYHHERPSTRFKLNFLQRAKSVPSLPKMTGQWQTDNTSFFRNQEKLKTSPLLRHNSNLLPSDENVEKYQAISSIDEENEQCTLTNTAHDGKDTSQKCPTNIDGITVNRRFSNDCDPSDGCEIKCTPVGDVLNNGAVGAEIAVNKCVLNDTAESNKITVDSLTDLQTIPTINAINRNLEQDYLANDFDIGPEFPLSYNISLAAECIKTTEGHHSEERCLLLSQDGVTEQQSVTNLDNYRDKPLEHLLDNRKMEINENFQKDKPEINNAISPAIRHHSAASVTGITKNTLQRGTSKVTDIYHHERPSTRFKLNFLQRAKSVPSLSEMTGQWQTDNTSFFSNQVKLKTPPPIRHNSNLLLSDENVEKYQAISSIDEENEQCTLTNTAHDGKDTSQKCPTNIDGITVNRRFSNDCDPSDGCEIKCTPVGDVLNNGAVGAEIAVNKCVLNDTAESNKITVDSLTDLQTIPTINAINRNLEQDYLANDFDIGPEFPLSYNISLAAECIKTTEGHHSEERCLLLSQDGVTEQQSVTNLDNYRDKPLEHLLDNRKMEIMENFQKDKPEINNAISPAICHHSAASVTGITKNTLQRGTSKVTDIYHHERPSTRFKLNFLQRAKSVPSLPKMTGQWQTDNTSFYRNQEKLKTSPLLRHNSNLLPSDENVEKYQAISSIDEENEQCTLTNTAHDGKDTSQKCPTNIDGITVNRRFSNDCDPSDGCEIKCTPVGDVLNNGAVGAEIAVNKCVLNDTAKSNKITVDSLTDLQTIPTINAINRNLEQDYLTNDFDIGPEFPLSYNISLAAECIKTTEGHHSEERCLLLSQDGVTEQQSVTNLDNYRDKPLEHLLDNRKMEINENFQKGKPEINNVISPAIRHHSAVSVTGITKNTLQRGTSKVTDIYHHERPSIRFKLNFLQRAKSVPSLLKMTGQWQTDNTSFFRNQEKLKTSPLLRHNSNLLPSDENIEKYQAISSIDEENEQCTLTNTAHDGKDTSQKWPTNIDGITVNRRFSNDCDPSDGCEIKCTPVGDVLNNGAVGAEIAVNKCVLNDTAESNKITVDSLTDLQTIPTINAINRKLEQDYLANDFDIGPEFPLSYNISLAAECIKTTEGHHSEERCLLLSQDGVTEQQSVTNLDNYRDKPLEHLLDNRKMEIMENFQKDKPEINNAISPAIRHHSAASVTGITKNTLQRGTSKVTDIYHHERPSTRFKLNFLQRAKSVPSLSEMTGQWQTDNTSFFSNQVKLKTPPPIRHNSNLLLSDENVEKYQAISSIDEENEQCTLTNTAHDGKDTSQKCPTNIDGITVNRRFSNDCDPSDGCEIKCTPVGDVLNNGAVGAEIAVNKCVLNDTAESNKITVDSLTDLQTIPTINAINRNLEQDYLANDFDIGPEFPLSYNISLAAECIKTTEGHLSEEICLVLSQNGVTEHQSVTNLDTPLEHLLNSTEMEINENFQKDEPKINNVVSPVMLHHSAASVTDITKNTSLQGNTKVTDIYHRRRPSNKFKLDFLQGAKSIPSLSELTEQWQSDNILFFSNQEKLKTPPPLRHNINLLPSDENVAKCQAVSSTDEVNEQYTLTNTAHDSMDTSQKCPTNIDGITVKRKFSDDCDPQEGCGIKCTRSPLNPDSGQLLHVDPSLNNEHKPTSQVLNYADSKHSKRLDNHKNKRVDLSGTLQISPISTAHSNKNKSLNQSSTVLSKGIDEFNATHILPMLGPVISQQPSNSSFKMLSDLLNNGAVGAEIETDKISPIDSLTGFQTVQTITDIHENLGQDYLTRDFDIFHDELTNEKSNINRLHKTNDAPPSPKVDVQYITTNIISKNQDKRARHSARRADIVMGRTNKPNAKDHFLLPSSQQAPSSIIKNKQSLIHSPLRSDFEMNVADVKSVAHGQLQNNRDASLPSPIGLKSSSDTSCGNNIQFQNSSPKKNMCSRKTIGIKSANDTNLAKPDHLTEQESPDDLTYNKNNKYLNEPMKDRDVTFDRRWKDIRVKTEKYSNSSGSTPPDSPPGRSPQNKYILKNYSTNSCDISPQDIDIAKENRKVFRYRRKSFPGRMLENGRSGTCTTNKPTFNSLQHCYPENQIDSEFREINDLHNRLNTNSDFSQHRVNSFSTDKDDNSSVNNNYQTGATRFSKKYSRFKSSRISESHNVQNRYGHLFRTKCLKDIHSHCNLSSQHDQENVFSTNIRFEPKLTTQERQAKPFPSFLSYKKRSRLYGYYPDLPFSNRNEFDYNIWSSYNDRQDDDELINRNEDESNISKREAVKKDTYQENKKHGRQCKPEFDKKAASRSIEDVFDPLPSEVTQDLGMDDETVKNNEYFPVDIKMFWPKENPTDIIRLLSSTSTGSKLSEESLSPQSHRVPAEILRPNLSCYSGTDSDTTTDDEYFLDSNETAKESAL